MSREEKEKRNKRTGIIISVGSHVAVILLFIFLVAWRAPNPPLPEFGIELNFGTSDVGTGEIQPQTPAAVADEEEDSEPDTPEEVEEVVEEVTEAPVEEVTEVTEPVEETVEEIIPVTETPTEAPVEEVIEKPKEEVKKEEPTPLKVPYPKKEGQSKNSSDSNQGNDKDKTGDKGDTEGDLDDRASYNKAGGGDGAALEMAGWMWDAEPDPKESTSQSGKIVFVVIIDDKGNVISAKAESYTVSASLVKIYQAEVERLTFSKTSSGKAPASSAGKITFIIKAK